MLGDDSRCPHANHIDWYADTTCDLRSQPRTSLGTETQLPHGPCGCSRWDQPKSLASCLRRGSRCPSVQVMGSCKADTLARGCRKKIIAFNKNDQKKSGDKELSAGLSLEWPRQTLRLAATQATGSRGGGVSHLLCENTPRRGNKADRAAYTERMKLQGKLPINS